MYLTRVGTRLEWTSNDDLIAAWEREHTITKPRTQVTEQQRGALVTNLEAVARLDEKTQSETLLILVKNQWQLAEIINRGDVPSPKGYAGIQEALRRLVEWVFQECDDPDLEFDLTEPKGNA